MPTTKSLQELIVAAHFRDPLSLTIMDVASWVGHFDENFPIIQQLPALPPANLPIPNAPVIQQVQFMTEPPLPRMFLRTADGRHSVQLQNDRFAFGWHRTEPIGEPAAYLGFEAHREHWNQALSHFENWTVGRFQQRPAHRLIEMNYSNAVPLEIGGQRKRLSEIFTFVQPGGQKVIGFATNWTSTIYPIEGTQPPKGIVQSVVALGTAPPSINVLAFNFMGLATVAPGEQSGNILSDVHAKIREIYEGAIKADAD
jgi:uncharacterized protein (TIGR04255 family)